MSQSTTRRHSPPALTLLILPMLAIFIALLMLAMESRPTPAPAPTFAPAPPRSVLDFAAPDFQLPMLDGRALVSPGDYAGRPLFLNFWGDLVRALRPRAARPDGVSSPPTAPNQTRPPC